MNSIEPIFLPSKPLGLVLQLAGLISAPQVEVALYDRDRYQELRLGEILALRGWLKVETADFFAEQWPLLLKQKREHPIGYYLQQAALLNEWQIKEILDQQQQRNDRCRFGQLAVEKKLLKQKTIDFLLLIEKRYNSATLIADIIDRVLHSGQITFQEQDKFLAAMLQEHPLSRSEQAGIKEIFDRLQKGKLQIIK